MSRRWATVVLWILPLAVGCGEPTGPRNVLILTLDTTRADRFGCYGFTAARTPNFDRFSEERAIRFEHAITAVPLTLPSHITIMTGTYPVFHGVHDNDGYVLDEDVTTLAETLSSRGFTTGAFLAAFPLDSQFNLDQGFDTYDDDFQTDWTDAERRSRTPFSFGFLERKSNRVNLAVDRWLERHSRDRFFLWVHYFDPHQPYNAAPPYDSLFSDSPYDGEIAFMDENFGKLLAMLDARKLLEDTLIVIVGDHGEGLGQHGESTHASYLYDATMRVPLWISVPDRGYSPGSTVAAPVRTLDIAPTVLDLLGLPPGQDMQGKSLRPLLADPGADWSEDALLEAYYAWFHYNWAPLRGLRTRDWKYIQSPRPELYDLESDPAELINLASQDSRRVAEMEQELRRRARRSTSADRGRSAAATSDAATLQKLRALGYLSGAGSTSLRARDYPQPDELATMVNPLDQSLVLSYINFASELARQKIFDEAISVARNGLAIDAENYHLRITLARAQAGLGLYDRSLVEIEKGQALRPDEPSGYSLAGHIHYARREFLEAKQSFARAVEKAPDVVEDLINLGLAHAALDELDEAISHFETVLELDPGSEAAVQELAKVYARAGRWEDARQSFQQALDRNPYSPTLLYNIAVFYRRVDDLEFSRRMFAGVLQVAPNHVAANVQLAELMLQAGEEMATARPYLEKAIAQAPESLWGIKAQELLEPSN